MSTRAELLDVIRLNPLEDAPRLMYADWLADHGEGDLDAATAEFVWLSCNFRAKKKSDVMPKACYPWLAANWHRLIPSALQCTLCVEMRTYIARHSVRGWRGRHLNLMIGVPRNTGAGGAFMASTNITFHRGFVTDFEYWAAGVISCGFLEALKRDQPLLNKLASNLKARA